MNKHKLAQEWRIRRGDIYSIDMGANEEGRRLVRPVLVVQNDIGNRLCSSIIVVPLAPERLTRQVLFGVLIPGNKDTGLNEDHLALFSQVRTLDKFRFGEGNFLGAVNGVLRKDINEALEISLGLSALQYIQDRLDRR